MIRVPYVILRLFTDAPTPAASPTVYRKTRSPGLDDSEIHAGYEFEAGMFSRMRSWVDVAPWIRLVRVLRILASPSYVGLVAILCAITTLAFGSWFDGQHGMPSALKFQRLVSGLVSGWNLQTVLLVSLAALLWIPVMQLVCRGGASLTAGKSLPSIRSTLRLVGSRLWKSYLVPIVPWVCVLAFSVAVFLIRIPSLLLNVPEISKVTGWMIGVCSIPIGILAFGALFAIPLGLVAMTNEPDPDPIDSLSRGYEYLFRRPMSLIGYSAFASLLIWLAGYLLGGVGWAASLAVSMIGSIVSPDPDLIDSARQAIGLFVSAWLVTLGFGLLGGVYLLLRRDAGGQEVEELWAPPLTPSQALPSLPKETYDS